MSDKTPTASLSSVHSEALERFKLANNSNEEKQRQRELDDLKFALGNSDNKYQWPPEIVNMRAGGQFGSFNIPQRPCLTINKLKQPIQQLENQQRTARLAIKISPKGTKAKKKTAEMQEGLYRNIEVESRASIARNWAYSRAIKCGRGYYRIHKRYADDESDDQELIISRILNQHAVYLDPFAVEPDWSDGEWGFYAEDMPIKTHKRLFPDAELSKADDETLRGVGDDAPGWIGGDDETSRTVRVVEYWAVQHSKRKSESGGRDIEDRTVLYYKLNAREILEGPIEWDGKYVPIVPVIANEENINGVRTWEGIVAPAKDAQRGYNGQVSAEFEAVALAPKSPFIAAEGQTEPYAAMWQQANVRNFPVMVYKPTTVAGSLAPPPQRQFAEPPIQAIAASIQQADRDLRATTGFYDATDPTNRNAEQSGRAVIARRQQGDQTNGGYLDNLASISMTYEAKVILDLMPKVYDRPGRIARILGVDDEPSAVMLNQPFVKGEDGEPQPYDPAQHQGKEPEHYDLKDGTYCAAVSVGKAYATAEEESVDMIGQLIQAEPQLFGLIGDIWIGKMPFSGAADIAERVKKMLPPQLQSDQNGQPAGLPPQAQAQIAQLQQALQQAQQMADANMAKLQIAQLKAESDERIKAMEANLKAEIEKLKAGTQVQTTAMKEQGAMARDAMQAEHDRQAHLAEMAHENHQADRQVALHGVDLAHDRVMADTSHVHNKEIASMKPEPAGGAA